MENILLGLIIPSKFWTEIFPKKCINLIFSVRVVIVKTSDWKTIAEIDYPKAAQLAYSSKGTYLIVYEPFMSK